MFSFTSKIISSIASNPDVEVLPEESKYLKEIIRQRIKLFRILFYNIIENKLEEKKLSQYKNINHVKNFMTIYNNLIDDIQNFLYSQKKLTKVTLDVFKNEQQLEFSTISSPFSFIYNIIDYHITSDIISNMIDNNEKIPPYYPANGLFCFICYHKTKLKSELNILVFQNELNNKQQNITIDIYPLIQNKFPNLILELENIIDYELKHNLKNIIKHENWFQETNFVDEQKNIYLGYVASLTFADYNIFEKKNNSIKLNILDFIYYNQDFDYHNIKINLYFRIYQYKKQTKKYLINSINCLLQKNKNNYEIVQVYTNKKYISYQIPINHSKAQNWSTNCLFLYNKKIYNDLLQTNKYIISDDNRKKTIKNIILKNENDKLLIDVLNSSNESKKIWITAKEILYTNFKNLNNYIVYSQNKIYIKDIILKQKDLITNNIFNSLKELYYIRCNNIISMDHIKIDDPIRYELVYNYISLLYKLSNINSNVIDWPHFIYESYDFLKEIDIEILTSPHVQIFSSFFDHYIKIHPIKARQIGLTFTSFSLEKMLKSVYNNTEQNIIDDFKEKYIKSNYIIQNCTFVSTTNGKSQDLILNENIHIINIFFYLYKKYKK